MRRCPKCRRLCRCQDEHPQPGSDYMSRITRLIGMRPDDILHVNGVQFLWGQPFDKKEWSWNWRYPVLRFQFDNNHCIASLVASGINKHWNDVSVFTMDMELILQTTVDDCKIKALFSEIEQMGMK